MAQLASALLAVTAIVGGLLVSPAFVGTVAGYLVLNLAYSIRLKRIPYLDVLCIALGFELRVLAGAFAADVPASAYLIVVTFLLALFLGFGKRMHELSHSDNASSQRSVLRGYGKRTLRILLFATGACTLGTYVVYTLDPNTAHAFGTSHLVVTAPFTLFGVLRFLHIVSHRRRAESPTEEMLRDWAFLGNLILWAITVVLVIYLS